MPHTVAKQKRKKETRKMGTTPHPRPLHLETITGKCIMTNLLKEPSKQMIRDWQGLKQFEELAKYISKELHASGTKLGVEEKITTPQQNMGVMTMMAWTFPQAPMLILKRMMQTQKTATMAMLRMFCCHQTTQLSPSLKHIAYVPNISCLCKEDIWQPLN
jgi:hypothetical protein